jgi:hypothetical protein
VEQGGYEGGVQEGLRDELGMSVFCIGKDVDLVVFLRSVHLSWDNTKDLPMLYLYRLIVICSSLGIRRVVVYNG